MPYRIELTKQAEKSFALIMKSQPDIGIRIAHAIDTIASDPSVGVPLKGTLKGLNKETHHARLLVKPRVNA